MDIKIAATTKLNYQATKEEFDKLGGLAAGVCYLPDTLEKLFGEDDEKTKRRVDLTKNGGHHSPYDHAYITLELIGIPKIIAMTINNENMYTTSEKSARYKVMKDVDENEKELYDKWMEIFKDEISKKYKESNPVYFNDKKITKLAQENARYLTSVFTPTTMLYTFSYRQLNVMYSLINKEIERIKLEENSPFYDKYSQSLQEFSNELAKLPYIDEKLFDRKGRSLSLIDHRKTPIIKQYGDVYQISYKASFAQLAQAQRHRTLDYKFRFCEEEYYVPPIIKDNKTLALAWCNDCKSLANLFPQGLLLEVIESGTIDNLILKAKERKCAAAQLEIDNQTTSSIMEIYDELKKEKHPAAETLKPYAKKSSRCTFGDYTCTEPCGFKEGITGERII